MRIHGIQLAYDDEESIQARRDRVVGLLRDQRGADLIVLPELWPQTGFGFRTWEQTAEPLDGPTVQAVGAVAAELGTTIHAGSIIERDADGRLWNTSVLIGWDGRPLAVYRKIHRFGFGVGEPTLLQPGTDLATAHIPVNPPGGSGDHRGAGEATVLVGLATCYDLRFPELFRAYGRRDVEMVLVPAAWPAARVWHWTLLGQARAIENQTILVQVNTAGTHAGTEMGGMSQVLDATGAVHARAGADQTVLVVDIDPTQTARTRQAFPVLADRRLV